MEVGKDEKVNIKFVMGHGRSNNNDVEFLLTNNERWDAGLILF